MAASKEDALRAVLDDILVDHVAVGPVISIPRKDNSGVATDPIELHFVPDMPFRAMAALISSGAADGMPDFLKVCMKEEDHETFDGLEITWKGMEKLVSTLTELYAGNSATEPS